MLRDLLCYQNCILSNFCNPGYISEICNTLNFWSCLLIIDVVFAIIIFAVLRATTYFLLWQTFLISMAAFVILCFLWCVLVVFCADQKRRIINHLEQLAIVREQEGYFENDRYFVQGYSTISDADSILAKPRVVKNPKKYDSKAAQKRRVHERKFESYSMTYKRVSGSSKVRPTLKKSQPIFIKKKPLKCASTIYE